MKKLMGFPLCQCLATFYLRKFDSLIGNKPRKCIFWLREFNLLMVWVFPVRLAMDDGSPYSVIQ